LFALFLATPGGGVVRGEPAAVTELNFTPGTPRALQIGLDYRF